MRLKQYHVVLIIILVAFADTKRSRGRSRGSSSGSTSFWTRKNGKSSESQKTVAAPKPSAPKEPELKKQTANVQQSSPVNSGKPIGWNVDNSASKKINQPNQQSINPAYGSSGAYPQNSGYSPGLYQNQQYPNGGPGLHSNPHSPPAYPGYSHGNSYNPQPPGYYPSQVGGYGGGHHNQMGGYGAYPNQMGGHGAYPNQMGGHGAYPNQMGGHGAYPNQMGGYGGYPNQMGGYGGYPHMPQQQTGLMGSMFGGNKHSYGGYGGGFGGYGNGYGMKKSGGFFGKHAFRNVLGGLFVWYLVSGLVSKPYKVYNYYNVPKEQREEITLPANVLTLCNENATNICVPGTTAICTQDSKILCVTTLNSVSPCQNNTAEACINTTIPCLDTNDPLCQNKTNADNTTTVTLPCITNMTLETSTMSLTSNVTLPESDNNKFCVTTMAVPDPNAPVEASTHAPDVKSDNAEVSATNMTGFEYYYTRYGSGYGTDTLSVN